MAPKKALPAKAREGVSVSRLGTVFPNTISSNFCDSREPGSRVDVLVAPENSPGVFSKTSPVAVYERRRKPLSRLPLNDADDTVYSACPELNRSSDEELPSTPDISDKGGSRRISTAHSYPVIGRSLSVRGRRSSVVRLMYDCSDAKRDTEEPDSPWVPQSADKRELYDSGHEDDTRAKATKTRAPPKIQVPRAYIAKQQAAFAEVDAFELEEESPTKQDEPKSNAFDISGDDDFEGEYFFSPELTEEQFSKAEAFFGGICQAEAECNDQSVVATSQTEAGDDSQCVINTRPGHDSVRKELLCDGAPFAKSAELVKRKVTSPSRCSLGDPGFNSTESEEREGGRSQDSGVTNACLIATLETGSDAESVLPELQALRVELEGTNFEAKKKLSVSHHQPKLACSPVVEEGDGEVEFVPTSPRPCDLAAAGTKEDLELLPLLDRMLVECHQRQIGSLREAITEFCSIKGVVKLGEGTYGEAFSGADLCFKIVPMDGEMLVNGEPQKPLEEMLNETVLTNALCRLREEEAPNRTSSFIETKGVRVCRGAYEPELIEAWEKWDAENTSENEHPLCFQENQLYTVFVFANGGRDLEHCILNSYNEARSVLLQVVVALATAEQSCGFEHRDLHWGNVLVASVEEEAVQCRLDGRDLCLKTCGVSVSVIDFTLSRLDVGKRVLFFDMSDPSFFEGPSGDIQSDTYRRMRKVTKGNWEKRCPKTNALWIHYLADIILNQKYYPITSKEKTALRAFRKRSLLYSSAVTVVDDKFFRDLLVWQ